MNTVSGSLSSEKVQNGPLLLRRPRPPKPAPKHSDGVPFDTRMSQSVTPKAIVCRRRLLPTHEDVYRTDIDEMVDECSKFIIHPTHPKGPEFFPPGKILHAPVQILMEPFDLLPDEIYFPGPECTFTLDNFLLRAERNCPPLQISQGMISRENYLKLTGWFATHVPTQEKVNLLNLEVDHQAPAGRVPRQQVLIELQAMVKKVIDECSSDISQSTLSTHVPSWPAPAPDDTLIRTATARYFCGQARNDAPFDARHQPLISPSEGAVLESMMTGGSHLSLKAHFISELPLLTPLAQTLTSLNLSYNSFKEFPMATLEFESLIFLSLRNNPLRNIPNDIRCLHNLCFLCLSFCNLPFLPSGLFELHQVVDLDVSYNKLQVIPSEICKLKKLKKLNIEGNQLCGLPASALCLRLSHIVLGNNLMHPLLWKENARNQPQSLVDICCVVLNKSAPDMDSLPPSALDTLQGRSWNNRVCEECQDQVFGPGLTVIRTVYHDHFEVPNLPFIFTVCSPRCMSLLSKKSAKFWLKKLALETNSL